MPNPLSAVSLSQLQQALALKEQIAALESHLNAILGGAAETPTTTTPALLLPRIGRPPGGTMSAEARARIAAAQKTRWAKFHESRGTVPKSALPKKGGMSPAGRARIIAAQKAWWAKFHASSGAVQKSALPKKGGMSRAERGRVAAKARWAYRLE